MDRVPNLGRKGLSMTTKNQKLTLKKSARLLILNKPQRTHSSIKIKCLRIQYFIKTLLKIHKTCCRKCHKSVDNPKLRETLYSSPSSTLSIALVS